MSMKRSKQSRSYSKGSGTDDDSYFAKPAEPEPSWDEVAAKPDDQFIPYSMASRFAKGALIAHSKFGKGLVLAVEGASIQVLFQDGKKKLGHTLS
jgi:hypothetical protein